MTELPDRGTCFGFAVRSGISFRYLRSGSGEPLEVRVGKPSTTEGRLLFDWDVRDPPLRARLQEADGRFQLRITGTGWFEIDPDEGRITVPSGSNAALREVRTWGLPAILCFLARGRIPIHAASVQVDGEAILLAAPGTFGKTTLAAGFLREGCRLLSEDVTCVDVSSRPAAIPGPAVVRMRRDVATALDSKFLIRMAEDAERVHFAPAAEHRGDCAPVPIRAIVFLRPSEDGIRLDSVPPAEVIRNLFILSFRLPSDIGARARAFAGVGALADAVPVWEISYPHVLCRLREVVETLASRV
jgi:hypothetical protein